MVGSRVSQSLPPGALPDHLAELPACSACSVGEVSGQGSEAGPCLSVSLTSPEEHLLVLLSTSFGHSHVTLRELMGSHRSPVKMG